MSICDLGMLTCARSLLVAVSGCQLTLSSWTVLLVLRVWLVTNDVVTHLKCFAEPSSCGAHVATRYIYIKSRHLSRV